MEYRVCSMQYEHGHEHRHMEHRYEFLLLALTLGCMADIDIRPYGRKLRACGDVDIWTPTAASWALDLDLAFGVM